jgi:hypothetical protein
MAAKSQNFGWQFLFSVEVYHTCHHIKNADVEQGSDHTWISGELINAADFI